MKFVEIGRTMPFYQMSVTITPVTSGGKPVWIAFLEMPYLDVNDMKVTILFGAAIIKDEYIKKSDTYPNGIVNVWLEEKQTPAWSIYNTYVGNIKDVWGAISHLLSLQENAVMTTEEIERNFMAFSTTFRNAKLNGGNTIEHLKDCISVKGNAVEDWSKFQTNDFWDNMEYAPMSIR